MRRNYVYAITILLMSLFLWVGYYLYLENRPTVYKNGTLVEAPVIQELEEWELSA